MKNLLTTLFVAILSSLGVAFGQVELKGIALGKNQDCQEMTITSVGGVKGAIFVSRLDDGRIYSICFIPSEDEINVARIYSTQAESILKGIRVKYDIPMRKIGEESYDGDWGARSIKDGVSYTIIAEYNRYTDKPYNFTLYITNMELDIIAEKEEQEKANKDF